MTYRTTALLTAALLAAAFHAGGQTATTRLSPARPDRTPASRPAEKVDPAAMKVLKRLEAAADKHPRLQAALDFRVDHLQTGESERRTGFVYYQAAMGKEPAKFRVHFDHFRDGDGPKIRDEIDYVFDGRWLTVRKARIKQMIRYQVAPEGRTVNALELGKGPFPVPFGQKAETVLEHFVVGTRDPAKTDPPKTDYLKLLTRPAHRRDIKLVWAELWVQRETGLPVKVVGEDKSENRTTVVFKSIETPKDFPKTTFDLPRPPRDWEYRVEKFEGKVE